MEKDSDLTETGTKAVELKGCEHPADKGSILETTERNLLHSIILVFFLVLCAICDELLFHELNDDCFMANFIYTTPANKQMRSDKVVVVL